MKNKIYKVLEELNINYSVKKHKAIFTAEEFYEATKEMPGHHCKNLFVKNSNSKQYYLIIAKHDTKIDLKNVRDKIGSSRLSFSSEEKLYEILKVKPGSVNPFCLINDEHKKVSVYLEKGLLDGKSLNFHPSDNTETLNITLQDLMRFFESLKRELHTIDL